MFGVKKCIGGSPREQTPVFDSLAIPDWMQTLHTDDARHERLKRARLRRHITKQDDPDGFRDEDSTIDDK